MQDTTIIAKIKGLIKNAHKFDNMQFRLLLEELVKKGGTPAQNVIGAMVTDEGVDSLIRINIIRIMGYIKSINFLLPLRKVLESKENLNLRKAAIISISKYNDNRALNMLNAALKRIENPVLQDSISSEISRIKNENPILGLMPKFLNGVNDPKTFRTTLEVLKQVLNPKDAHTFIYHLNSEIPFVGDGAFEVLCWRGDEAVKFSIFDYYRKKMKMVEGIEEEECVAAAHLVSQLRQFLVRNPDTVNYVLKELKELYRESKDKNIKDVIIDIFCQNHKREVLSFLEIIYNNEPERRLELIEKLEGNEDAVFILLYQYKNAEELKGELLKALFTTQKGSEYIIEIFDTFSPGSQKMILENITPENYRFFKKLIERFLLSNDSSHKRIALLKMSEAADYSFHHIIFAPEHEAEFMRMHMEFIQCISGLYPIKTFKFFLKRVINLNNSRGLIKRFFDRSNLFSQCQPVVTLDNKDDVCTFITKLTNFNNKEINNDVLETFYNLKTFDYPTFTYLQAMLEEFKGVRGQRITPEERGMANKVAANLLDINSEIKNIQKGKTNLDHFFKKSFLDYEVLEYIIRKHPMTFFFNRDAILDRIRKTFQLTNELDAFDSIKFLLRHKKLSTYFVPEITKSAKSANYLLKQDAEKLLEEMPGGFRIALFFKTTIYYSYVKDQLNEILPEAQVLSIAEAENDDVLIADIDALDILITENRVIGQKKYIFLNDASQFASIKEYNPKVFPPPFSLYKLMKALIADLLTEEEAAPEETEKNYPPI